MACEWCAPASEDRPPALSPSDHWSADRSAAPGQRDAPRKHGPWIGPSRDFRSGRLNTSVRPFDIEVHICLLEYPVEVHLVVPVEVAGQLDYGAGAHDGALGARGLVVTELIGPASLRSSSSVWVYWR